VLAEISGLYTEHDGYVWEAGYGYGVLDVRRATATVREHLSNVKPFEDGGRVVHEAPPGLVSVQESGHGCVDYYLHGNPPTYERTAAERYLTVPEHARLSGVTEAVVGLRPADNLAHPSAWMVTAVVPVLPDGRVDMRLLAGTEVRKVNGWPEDAPTGPISMNEARGWFERMVWYSGVKCQPSR